MNKVLLIVLLTPALVGPLLLEISDIPTYPDLQKRIRRGRENEGHSDRI